MIKNGYDFVSDIKKGILKGEYDLTQSVDSLMDLDFNGVEFIDCKIRGGDLACGIFTKCLFNGVKFIKSELVGVNFNSCCFVDIKFENCVVSLSFKS